MAKSNAPLGTTVSETVVTGPQSLYNKTISLNLKACKWFDSRTRDPHLHLDAKSPTIQIPGAGQVAATDLECIFMKLKAGHIVLGSKPIPEIVVDPDVLARHVSAIKAPMAESFIINYISEFVRGPQEEGGYSKLQLLEYMLDAEAGDPDKGIKGRNRNAIVKHLKEAIQFVTSAYGGVSKVSKEEIKQDMGSSGRVPNHINLTPEKAAKFLEI